MYAFILQRFVATFLGDDSLQLQSIAGQGPYLPVQRLVERFRVYKPSKRAASLAPRQRTLLVGLELIKVASIDANVVLRDFESIFNILPRRGSENAYFRRRTDLLGMYEYRVPPVCR